MVAGLGSECCWLELQGAIWSKTAGGAGLRWPKFIWFPFICLRRWVTSRAVEPHDYTRSAALGVDPFQLRCWLEINCSPPDRLGRH